MKQQMVLRLKKNAIRRSVNTAEDAKIYQKIALVKGEINIKLSDGLTYYNTLKKAR